MNPFTSNQLTRPWNYEKFELNCGHLGNIIWEGNGMIAVRGTKRGCRDCGKKGKGEWTPTVYIISKPEADFDKKEVGVASDDFGRENVGDKTQNAY